MRIVNTVVLCLLLLVSATALAQTAPPASPTASAPSSTLQPVASQSAAAQAGAVQSSESKQPAPTSGLTARDFPPGLQIPEAARPGPHFDVDKATESYLNLLSPEQRKLSDEYFEGGYWLQLWQLLYGIAIGVFLLISGISVRMRNVGLRLSRWRWLSTAIYALQWILVGYLLGLPMDYYSEFVREHQYGLSTQDMAGWLGDSLKGVTLAAIFLPLIFSMLYAAVRKAGERWWFWASVGGLVLFLLVQMVGPPFLEPVFNDFQPLPDGPVREAVLSLARANRIPTEHVEWFNNSKQTTRVSAHVSGFMNTSQVSLNDNLVNRTSLPEIRAVLGHEMGHYVLNHALRGTIYLSLVTALLLFLVHRSLDWALARWGSRLKLEGRDDPAALPLAVIAFMVFNFLATPLNNSIVRQMEAEADAFGLNAAREPNGFAMSAMRLSTYRKLRPGPLEEIVFYDHPSGYTRVHNSMIWLQENQDNPTANAPIAPPMAPLKFESTPTAASGR
jgi:STE24 endopeptidase